MRIHRLRLSAFGPFAGTEDVDVDALSADGLFLLNGETGAGKTSVLDAICFALYAGLPGAREGTTRLRSDHAEPGAVPEVVLEFSSGGRRFEVTRSPAWERPKARGTGTTRQQAQSRLRELVHGAWVEKSTRNDEVASEILAVLGLGKEQFTRVAMLPQGEFAAFLRSKDRDREALLKKLFDTSGYAGVEEALAQRTAALRERAAGAEAQRRAALDQLRADAADAVDGWDPDTDDAGLVEAFEAGLEAARGRVDVRLDAASTAHAAAIADAEELTRAARDHGQLVAWERRHAALEASTSQADAAGRHLAAHAEAAAAQPARRAAERAAAEHRDAVRTAESATRAVDEDGLAPGYHDAAESMEGARSLAAAELAVARAARPQEDELAATLERIAAAGRVVEAAEERRAASEREAAALEDTLPELRSARDAGAEAAGRVEGLRSAERAARSTAEAAEELERQLPVLRAAEEAWIRAEDARLTAQGRAVELGRRRLAQAAASLALGLEDGSPCPVCGAPEHPRPAAAPDGSLVQEADHEAAVAEAERLAVVSSGARDRRDEAARRADRLRGALGERGHDEAVEELAAAQAALAAAEGAVEGHRAAEAAVVAAEASLATARAGASAAAAERAAAVASRDGLAEQRLRLETALEAARGGHPSVAERVRALDAATAVLSRAAEALEGRARAARAHTEAEAEWARALADHGFDTAEDQAGALLPEAEAARQRETVERHRAELHRLEELGASEEVARARRARAAGVQPPDDEALEAAAARSAEARRGLDEALSAQAVLAQQSARFAVARDRLAALEARQGPLLAEYDLVSSLAELARGTGENRLKMTLSTYVLAARLEAVAAAATERLDVMSSGRYRLVHDDGPRGNNKSGLGLQVVDAWTGQQRDTATLSGGESFMASLALALGLADVVQQEAGGIDMETLFVDEGFGSLDEGALELVMNALDGLRQGGRVVGLVSHVPEMKLRIPTQLHVHKGRRGSRLELVQHDVADA
ncbi:SMC family ATPase [Zafaria sp. J156]|uniref:SMC family ATPase n=1 Tax=Zafaria sp. J156 TaxID=3116490 RepID=UPI002E79668C|nr:SMC family ATPase [Zafaria sp. J156]MEE1620816.1 SMC family ATPase [Zafaria sp. J156]